MNAKGTNRDLSRTHLLGTEQGSSGQKKLSNLDNTCLHSYILFSEFRGKIAFVGDLRPTIVASSIG